MKHTNKKLLARGIKCMAIAVPLMFLGPYLLTLGFLNKTNNAFFIFFPLGLIVAATAIYFGFKGIRTINKSIFD